MKRCVILCAFFLSACAALMNSGRPRYDGPILTPLWHVPNLDVAETPVIAGGTVFAVAPREKSSDSRAYAFDLKTGRQLWVSQSPASHVVGTSGATIFVSNGTAAQALDVGSGRPVKRIVPPSTGFLTYAAPSIYAISGERVLSAIGTSGATVWTHTLPVKPWASPIVAGSLVIAYGSLHVDELTPDIYGVYAFDRSTGAPAWQYAHRDRFKIPSDYRSLQFVLYNRNTVFVLDRRADEPYTNSLVALDATNGRMRWRHESIGDCMEPPSTIEPDVVLSCDGPKDPSLNGATFRALRQADGTTLWSGTTNWPYPRSIVAGRFAIVSDRRIHQVLNENNATSPESWLTLVDRQSGKELWRTQTLTLADLTMPAAGDGIVVAGSKPFTTPTDPTIAGSPDVAGLWAWPENLPAP